MLQPQLMVGPEGIAPWDPGTVALGWRQSPERETEVWPGRTEAGDERDQYSVSTASPQGPLDRVENLFPAF